jgi:oligoribonuclease
MLLWIDIETVGLNPFTDRILEVGIIATTNDLDEVWRASRVCHYDRNWASSQRVHLKVLEMHDASGLWDECLQSSLECSDVEDALLDALDRQIKGPCVEKFPMCGSTVGFDRSFLKQQMPRLHDFFHYRSIDVSTLTELARRWFPSVYASRPGADEAKKPHRALPDLEFSIATLKYYRETMLRGV